MGGNTRWLRGGGRRGRCYSWGVGGDVRWDMSRHSSGIGSVCEGDIHSSQGIHETRIVLINNKHLQSRETRGTDEGGMILTVGQ